MLSSVENSVVVMYLTAKIKDSNYSKSAQSTEEKGFKFNHLGSIYYLPRTVQLIPFHQAKTKSPPEPVILAPQVLVFESETTTRCPTEAFVGRVANVTV